MFIAEQSLPMALAESVTFGLGPAKSFTGPEFQPGQARGLDGLHLWSLTMLVIFKRNGLVHDYGLNI